MTAIDIGAGAVNRASAFSEGYTLIDGNNAANGTGTLTSFSFWFTGGVNANNVKAGTFSGSGTSYTSRDVEVIGTVSQGSKQTFSGLTCDVTLNDFAGLYWSGAVGSSIEYDSSGYTNIYYKSGDQFGAGAQTYTAWAGDAISIEGAGATASNTYEQSCTDGLKGGDTTVKGSITMGLTCTDGIKGGDTNAKYLSFTDTLTDGVKHGDTGTVVITFNPSATDGVKSGDTPVAQCSFISVATDGSKFSDVSSNIASLNSLATEGLKLSDINLHSLTLSLSSFDGLSLADVTSNIANLQSQLTDGFKLGDSNLTNVIFACALSDGVKYSEALSAALTIGLTLTDSTTLADAASTQINFYPIAADGTLLSDSIDADYWTITGITKSGTGKPLGGCVVHVFRTSDNTLRCTTTSDSVGVYVAILHTQNAHYLVAYKAGSPDVAGTTKNNLVGT